MTAEQYKPIYHWFSDHPAVKRLVVFLDRWLPLVPFVCYPVLLCLLNVRLSRLFLTQKQAALDFMVLIARSVFVPGLVFWGGTLLRSRLHFPRPYEQPGFTPLVAKESRGHSMPSRHALSAAVLAAVWLYFYPAAGCVMVGIALFICCLRGSPGCIMCGTWCAALHWALRWAVPECGCCKAIPTRWNGHFCPQRKKVETFFRFSLTECDGYGIISLAACADTELPP